jgi:S1-C subfamily serine protease
MKRLLTSLLVLSFLFTPLSMSAYDWSSTVRTVNASVVRLSHPVQVMNPFSGEVLTVQTSCTGFVINRKAGYVLTAEHCLNDGTTEALVVAGARPGPIWLVFRDAALDIAVISVPITRPALKPSRVVIQQGQMIGAMGFGYGFTRPMFRAGYVANIGVEVDPELPGVWALFDGPFIGGMSGGPIFNEKGAVVGVVQMSNEVMGLWRPFSAVYVATRAFWG